MRRNAFTLLELLVVIGILALLAGLTLAGLQRVRAAALRLTCSNHLRQVGVALHSYHDTHAVLPPGMHPGDPQFPFLGWPARILPFMEQDALWEQTLADFRSLSSLSQLPQHRNVTEVVRLFICPADGRVKGTNPDGQTAAFTHYLGCAGTAAATSNGVLYTASLVRFADITDGTSQTLIVGERPPSSDSYFGWWYIGYGQMGDGSADFHIGVREFRNTFRTPTCPPGPYHFEAGTAGNPCDTFHFWSKHIGGANFLYADGSVRFTSYGADPVLPALATRAGGEVVEVP